MVKPEEYFTINVVSQGELPFTDYLDYLQWVQKNKKERERGYTEIL